MIEAYDEEDFLFHTKFGEVTSGKAGQVASDPGIISTATANVTTAATPAGDDGAEIAVGGGGEAINTLPEFVEKAPLTEPKDIIGVTVFERLLREVVSILTEHAEDVLFSSTSAHESMLNAPSNCPPTLVKSAFSILKYIAEGDCGAVLWTYFFKVMIVRCGLRVAFAAQIALLR